MVRMLKYHQSQGYRPFRCTDLGHDKNRLSKTSFEIKEASGESFSWL
ncbi:hypothetical protein K1F50_07775 [Muricauda oceani]|uniref:Uncharacterized protein n=1 Tax=Flagellimonas oceani TaxID=2698672 RepID=A0A6G7J4F8_9FLAO|nr:hypothetical protein [Allomuricauda oceani]MBW8242697.1 hypothetical protein [Allomuricauda oceani]QII45560.1 hypothetical protein GVT53_13040 [Allomuricauda oceani]